MAATWSGLEWTAPTMATKLSVRACRCHNELFQSKPSNPVPYLRLAVSIPLLYCLGRQEELHTIARKQWEAVTWQFTQYGQVYNEWDAHYDWMHHGESSQFIYYLGLADPHHFADKARSLKFAGFYMHGFC